MTGKGQEPTRKDAENMTEKERLMNLGEVIFKGEFEATISKHLKDDGEYSETVLECVRSTFGGGYALGYLHALSVIRGAFPLDADALKGAVK